MMRISLMSTTALLCCLNISLVDCRKVKLGKIQQIPRVDWSDKKTTFATTIAWIDQPVVITNTKVSTESNAAKLWTPEYLAKNIPTGGLPSVKRYPAQEGTPLFASNMPMAAIPEFMQLYQPHYSRHDLPVSLFFNHMGIQVAPLEPQYCSSESSTQSCDEMYNVNLTGVENKDVRLSFSTNLNQWGENLVSDIDLDSLVPVAKETYDGPAFEVRPYVWMGQQNVVTPCHYDYFNNFFHMIEGSKHFMLFPPSAHSDLELHPSIHPAHRSSQLELPSSLPNPSEYNHSDGVDGWEVNLQPGEILFIPAFWFHHVTTLSSFALAQNVWSEIPAARHHAEALQVALPFVAELAQSESDDFINDEFKDDKGQILRAYFNLVLEDLRVGVNDSRITNVATKHGINQVQAFVQYHLLNSKYRKYFDVAVVTDDSDGDAMGGQWPRFCNDANFLSRFVSDDGGFGAHLLQATVKEVESVQ